MYQASVPVFLRALSNLGSVLRKGEAHATAMGYEPGMLLQARLAPDMFPLVRQVQIATDLAKNGAARLAGVDPMPFDDDETTFDQLYSRIDRATDYLQSFTAAQIDGSEGRQVKLKLRSGELEFDGQAYLLHFSLPNLFFHCTTTYALLRQAGVMLGKQDFMGAPR
ncbi:DUF1993 family protein [Luteimonas vadosa]|uniref:DUF1993 family protein n=2 Tax=Luteimonas vadosa TaxID=1165507 RepID=A0ABP9DNQ4_9GAMM